MPLRVFEEAPYIVAFEDETGGGLVHDMGEDPQVLMLETLQEAMDFVEKEGPTYPGVKFMIGKIVPLEN